MLPAQGGGYKIQALEWNKVGAPTKSRRLGVTFFYVVFQAFFTGLFNTPPTRYLRRQMETSAAKEFFLTRRALACYDMWAVWLSGFLWMIGKCETGPREF